MPSLVLSSVTVPATRPPGIGSHVRALKTTLSSSHQPKKLLVKWNRTSTPDWWAAVGADVDVRGGGYSGPEARGEGQLRIRGSGEVDRRGDQGHVPGAS